jgi:two-component system, chemotaxis family, chemotaxis protein CheY
MIKEILVIDDSKAIRFMLQTILRKHYKVTSVADGVSAMYCLRKNALPDLMIINPDLSDFPDWELIKYLQSSHFYSSVPMMVLSNQPENDTRVNSIKYGVVDFFLKPFNPLKLLESVDNILVGNTLSKIY